MRSDIQTRFRQIRWCNMALLSIRIDSTKDTDVLVLDIMDSYSDDEKIFEVKFEDTTYLSLQIDFATKRVSSNAIESADCFTDSPWKKTLGDANPYDNFSSYLHFGFGLVPKGGAIDLLALDFKISEIAGNSLSL